MHRPHLYSGGRYPVLRALAIIYLIGALLSVVAGIYTIWWAMTRFDNTPDRLILVSAACAATCIMVVSMLAVAEVLKLFIDIEHNTRIAAMRSVAGQVPVATVASSDNGGKVGGRLVELECIDEETAEAALLRGH